jgi:hypothetical protein
MPSKLSSRAVPAFGARSSRSRLCSFVRFFGYQYVDPAKEYRPSALAVSK